MEPHRTIRAPGTIVKSSRPNTYTGYLAQNKLKLIGSIIRDRPNSSNSNQLAQTNPKQTTPQQQQTNQQQTTQQQTVSKGNSATMSSTATNVTSRIPMKPSRLVKPTPIKQATAIDKNRVPIAERSSIVSPSGNLTHNTTYALKPPSTRVNATHVNTNARYAALNNHQINSTVSKPSLKTPNTGLDKVQVIKSATTLPKLTSSNISNQKENTTLENQVTSSSNNDIALTSVSEDVNHIRQLLEQLLAILKASSEDQDELAAENERLRFEVAELKEKIRAIKSTISTARDSTIPEEGESYESSTKDKQQMAPRSSVYSTPMI